MKLDKITTSALITLVIGLLTILFRIDPSMTTLNTVLQPDAFSPEYSARPPVALITYADGPPVFFKNQHALAASTADKGIDHIFNYSRSHIDPLFYAKNQAILKQRRGSGYWLWKPYFIYKTMQALPENSIIIYADSGVIITKNVAGLIKLTNQYSLLVTGLGTPIPLRTHIKREALNFFDQPLTEAILNSQNIWGFFIVVKNTAQQRSLIKKWLDICQVQDAITDRPLDLSNQDPLFQDHQHDQSLLSILIASQPDNSYYIIPRNILRKRYGIHNFHRHPEDQYKSPLFISAGLPQWISEIFWNNAFFRFIRKVIYRESNR